jgi:nudix-type nucleoside diphosphatase (YffH/AdpP family)
MDEDDVSARVKLHQLDVLSDNHYILRNAHFDFLRRDGSWQSLARESYDRGHGAAVLPLDAKRGMVLLVRQFRWPAFEAGYRRLVIEAPAGLLDGDDPETCVRKEAVEEAGVTLGKLTLLFHCFMSPGAVTERLSLFLGEYDSTAPRAKGGGLEAEGEDIELVELKLSEAMAMVTNGDIVDAKTIMLLQAAERASHPSTSSG